MATGQVTLRPGDALTPDGTTTNAAPALSRVKSSATAPAPYFLQLSFDATAEEWATWQFRMPMTFGSAPVAKVQFKMASATSGGVVWGVQLAAVTPGDATILTSAKTFATINQATTTVPGTAGYLAETSITLTNNDSVAAGDFVVVRLARLAADGSDTATGDADFLALGLTFTTV